MPTSDSDWNPERRSSLVLRILRRVEPIEAVCAEHGIATAQAERWTRLFVEGGQQALRDGMRAHERIRELERKLGEMALEMDRLRKRLNFGGGEPDSAD